MPLLGIEPGAPQREASTQAKSYLNSVLSAIRTITYEPATWSPPMHLVTWTYMNTLEKHCSPLASHTIWILTSDTCKSAYSQSSKTYHIRVTSVEILAQDHLHPKLEVPRLTCLGPKQTLASAVGGQHSSKELFEQRVNSYSEHLHMSPWQ
jgi:hypothetical protein